MLHINKNSNYPQSSLNCFVFGWSLPSAFWKICSASLPYDLASFLWPWSDNNTARLLINVATFGWYSPNTFLNMAIASSYNGLASSYLPYKWQPPRSGVENWNWKLLNVPGSSTTLLGCWDFEQHLDVQLLMPSF